MVEMLFPRRQRCKECRKGMGAKPTDPVIIGLYCSTKCGGLPEPASDPKQAPRECTTTRDGETVFKRRYRSEAELPSWAASDPSTSFYWCKHCGHGHIGHTRAGRAEQLRMFREPADLRDYLVKRRGAASVAQVAKAAGVRPIRLKELEEGKAHAEGLDTLFKVLAVLRTDLGVGIHPMR